MLLRKVIEETKPANMKPAMVLLTPTFKYSQGCSFRKVDLPDEPKNIPDEEILKKFSKNLNTELLIVYGIEPNCNMSDICSFIFSARKFFDPKVTRPLIIIYSSLNFDQLKTCSGWSGLYFELLQYGRIVLKCGYQEGYQTTTHTYFGHQYM